MLGVKIKHLLVLVGVLLCTVNACATAPVQEMSNARQALQAADAVDASNKAPNHYNKAIEHLERAEQALKSREYSIAKEEAKQAKVNALKARQVAVEDQSDAR